MRVQAYDVYFLYSFPLTQLTAQPDRRVRYLALSWQTPLRWKLIKRFSSGTCHLVGSQKTSALYTWHERPGRFPI